MRSAANVSQTLRGTEWQSLLKRLPRTLAEYIARKQPDCVCTLTPSLSLSPNLRAHPL